MYKVYNSIHRMVTKFVQNVAGCQPNLPHYSAFTLHNRLKYMDFTGYDIVALMEVNVESLNDVIKKLPYKSVSYFPYNKESKLFYVVASNIIPYSIGMYWFTENPYDDSIERTQDGHSKRGCVVACYNIGGRVLVDITVHLPIKPAYQVECVRHLCSLVKSLIENDHCDVVLAGDFNNINDESMLNPLKEILTYHGGVITFQGYANDRGLITSEQNATFRQLVGKIHNPRAYRRATAQWIINNSGQLRSSLDHVFTSDPHCSVKFEQLFSCSDDDWVNIATEGRPLTISDHSNYVIRTSSHESTRIQPCI